MEGEHMTERPVNPTGKRLTQDQGISAMMTLARYCREQHACCKCIFSDREGPCLLKGSTPVSWPETVDRRWKEKKAEV